jgi:hypothetical protein
MNKALDGIYYESGEKSISCSICRDKMALGMLLAPHAQSRLSSREKLLGQP